MGVKVEQRSGAPIRTCVGCRQRAAKAELLRTVVGGDQQLVLDPAMRRPGRGAYVHRSERCIEAAAGRGGLSRSLRRRLSPRALGRFRDAARAAAGFAASGAATEIRATKEGQS